MSRFFLRGASVYCCLAKGQAFSNTHTYTCTHAVVCLIAELDTELVEGRLMQKESASVESSFLFGSVAHTPGEQGLC